MRSCVLKGCSIGTKLYIESIIAVCFKGSDGSNNWSFGNFNYYFSLYNNHLCGT